MFLYPTPIGSIGLECNHDSLVSCEFISQDPESAEHSNPTLSHTTSPILTAAIEWFDSYFEGNEPPISLLPLAPTGTAFQQLVWDEIRKIPAGALMTYGEIARIVAKKRGQDAMSAQAVGGAVGRNPLPIIVPCHRVVGAGGKLTGYSSGMSRKVWLLRHENVDISGMYLPDGHRVKNA